MESEPACEPSATAARDTRRNDGVLDAGVLAEMEALLGEETVREVVGAFLAGARDFVATLRASQARGDRDEIVARLHRMVGSASAVGAKRLAGVCRQHEQALAKAATAESLDADELERLLDATVGALEAWLPVPGAPSG